MTDPDSPQDQAVGAFLAELMVTFDMAYLARVRGVSGEAILLEYDIVASGSPGTDTMKKAHRKTIQLASEAVEARVPMPVAHRTMMEKLVQFVNEILEDENK